MIPQVVKKLIAPTTYTVMNNVCRIDVDTSSGQPTTIRLQKIIRSAIRPDIFINDISNNASVGNIIIETIGGDLINNATTLILDTNGVSALISIMDSKRFIASLNNDEFNYVQATENTLGVTKLADTNDMISFFDDLKSVTPTKLKYALQSIGLMKPFISPFPATGYASINSIDIPTKLIRVTGGDITESLEDGSSIFINALTEFHVASAVYNPIWMTPVTEITVYEDVTGVAGYITYGRHWSFPLQNVDLLANGFIGSIVDSNGNQISERIYATTSKAIDVFLSTPYIGNLVLNVSSLFIFPSNDCEILSFDIAGETATGVIAGNLINVELDQTTYALRGSLAPTIIVSPKASIIPMSGQAVSFAGGMTQYPVHYRVTAEDGVTAKDYFVTVSQAPPSNACDMTDFDIVGSTAMPTSIFGTDVYLMLTAFAYANRNSLTPTTITLSPYATVSPANNVVNDFTNPVNYIVTAEDGITTKTYIIHPIDTGL